MLNIITTVIVVVIIYALKHRSAHETENVNLVLVSSEALTACPFSSNVAFILFTDACSLRIMMAFSALIWERFNHPS